MAPSRFVAIIIIKAQKGFKDNVSRVTPQVVCGSEQLVFAHKIKVSGPCLVRSALFVVIINITEITSDLCLNIQHRLRNSLDNIECQLVTMV